MIKILTNQHVSFIFTQRDQLFRLVIQQKKGAGSSVSLHKYSYVGCTHDRGVITNCLPGHITMTVYNTIIEAVCLCED